jgi:hypothetical protein
MVQTQYRENNRLVTNSSKMLNPEKHELEVSDNMMLGELGPKG